MRRFFGTVQHFFHRLLLPSWMAPEWMSMPEKVGFYITTWLGILFMLFYTYQFFYVLVALIVPPRRYAPAPQNKRYAVVIAARNESAVLPQLLKSIAAQSYPGALLTVFVVADNCTDNTAEIAYQYGANVFVRHSTTHVGKGYALAFLFDKIKENYGFEAFDGYFVFDADNVLRPDFVAQMHRAHAAGYAVLTSYRNSKNYGKSWISAGYALWFMRESRYLQNPRALLGASAVISGTGFLIDSRIVIQNGGWKHFLLTEDIEFTADCILRGERVGYCHEAELFDEQPETFAASWRQRKRWAKGMFGVMRYYGAALFKGALRASWPCYDMAVNVMPAFLISLFQLGATGFLFLLNWVLTGSVSLVLLHFLLDFFTFGYGIFLLLGAVALLSEWRHIHCPKWRAILLLFTFPVFMLTYIPISLAALFWRHATWQPIAHTRALDVKDIENGAVLRKPDK
ncbi:MAG: glycosyltransferase [Ruminococcaceae bacterium]|nr:glycosyltransferase [Oscillospiraceae bacterium]